MAARALPDLIARIKIDSSGVDSAMTNLVGSFGRANLALAGVAAGLGLLFVGAKSMVDITEKRDAAELGLAQAYKATGANLGKYQGQIDDFIKTNRRYISDQSEVIDGYAKLTRSGLSQIEVQRVMNDSVDLAALKRISLTDAVTLLDNAEHGRMRGLIDLGITTAKYTDAQGNLIKANHSVAQAMAEVDAKVKGGRLTLRELIQNSNELNNSWQNISKNGGPKLVEMLTNISGIADLTMQFFEKMGHNNPFWDAVDKRLADTATKIRDVALQLGIASPTKSELPPVTDPRAFKLDPALRDVRLTALGQGETQYQAEILREQKAFYAQQAADDKALRVALDKQAADQLAYLKQIARNTGGSLSGAGGAITVNVSGSNLSPWQIAQSIAWEKKIKRL